MERKHYFKDEVMIVCKETGGEFSKIFLQNNPLLLCPCCLEQINIKELKKWNLK